ncbi:MAG: alpha/beta fold hydrolase [Anaerolineae bacterium]|nr:alpha/beta fold hydrolase [Anaerolineae bacterium]
MKYRLIFAFLIVLSLSVWGGAAQDDAPTLPEPARVEVEASDGLVLVGDLYTPTETAEGGAPALLLMHQNQSRRRSWEPLLPALVEAGYVVLSVDLRGHGETGGRPDWALAQEDTQLWLTILQAVEGVSAEKIALMGASIGSNLALVGCAANEACQTAVALSPGLNFFNVQPEEAVSDGLRRRSALLIATRSDRESVEAVRQMAATSNGEIGLRVYGGFAHGTELFEDELVSVQRLVLSWLEETFDDEE